MFHSQWIIPDWPVAPQVGSVITTRCGGYSKGPYGAHDGGDGGMNLGLASGESVSIVERNRALIAQQLPYAPCWLKQVHGTHVVNAAAYAKKVPEADAAYMQEGGAVCAVLVADCMPVLLASTCARIVAVAHAGWRGLAGGIIQNVVSAMRARVPNSEFIAYLGPAIGPNVFEVGQEVLDAMLTKLPNARAAFKPSAIQGKYLADLYALGRMALHAVGVSQVYGGGYCTYSESDRFYSYRRAPITGRQAALIWLNH